MTRMFPGKEIRKNIRSLRVLFPAKANIKLKWTMIICGLFGSLSIMYSIYDIGSKYPFEPISFWILISSLPSIIIWSIYCMWLYDETFDTFAKVKT